MTSRPPFKPYHEREAVIVYRRNLPHWRQDGATYFVTFRLADALPKSVVAQWDDEKRLWLAARDIDYHPDSADWLAAFKAKLSPKERSEFHQLFNRKLNHHLDQGLGACHLRGDPCLNIVRQKLLQHDGTDYHLGDFVLMPNHVHLLINLIQGIDLERVMQRIKGGSSFLCNQALGRRGRLWQREYYDHLVRDGTELSAFQKYVRENPQKAGIRVPEHAVYHAEWLRAEAEAEAE
jgi:putative transposase